MTTKVLILSSACGVLAASTLFALMWPRAATESAPDDGRLARLEGAFLAATESRQSLASAMDALVQRIDGLETRVDRRASEKPVMAALTTSEAATPPRASEAETSAALQQEFLNQLADAVRTTRSGIGDDQEQFWEMARTTDVLDRTIDALQAQIASDPGDDEVRMQLADAYVAKLLTVPYGPERGIWGARAETEWQSVLENNPQHWEAQYVLAYNYSMYPDFVAKTDEAIDGFENAVRIQEGSQHRPEYAQTYVQLARMYEKKGQVDKARDALSRGASRHPGNETIAAELQRLRDG